MGAAERLDRVWLAKRIALTLPSAYPHYPSDEGQRLVFVSAATPVDFTQTLELKL
jgi:hypothetical protein